MYTTLRLTRREASDDDNQLPMLCMRCGAKASQKKRHQFMWAPPHIRMLGWIAWLLGKYMTVNVPLCDGHRMHFYKPLIVFGIGFASIALLMGLTVVVMIGGAATLGSSGALLGFAMFGLIFLAFIGLIVGVIWSALTMVRPFEITDREITLMGVSEKFVRTFEAQKKSGKSRPRREIEEEEEPAPRKPGDARGIQSSPGVRRPVAAGTRRNRGDEDDDDDLPRRASLPKKKTPVLMIILIIGGVLGTLGVVVCGGFIYLAYTAGQAIPQDNVVFRPGPDGGGFVLEPQEPRNLDQAVAGLKHNDPGHRKVAAEWLKKTPPDAARQGEVAGLLVNLLDDNDVWTRTSATEALFSWATKESVPALIQLATDNRHLAMGDAHQRAMTALGRLKDARAVPILAERLGNFFEHDQARQALETFGPAAEKEVLRYMNSKEDLARTESRKLLRTYGTTDAVLLQQTLSDLKDNDSARHRPAVEWLVTANVPADQQAAVAKALESVLSERDAREPAAKALARIAAKDNVPGLIRALSSDSREVKQAVTDALVRLKDERAAEPIAKLLTGFERDNAQRALADLGPIAEQAVLKYYHHQDRGARDAARSLLAGYKTKDDAILTQSLDDLAAKEPPTRQAAAEWLADTKLVKERQAEVATALEGLLTDRENHVSEAGMKALKVWVTKANRTALLDRANDKGFNPHANFMRTAALEVLGKIKDEKDVDVIAPHLANVFDRDAARKGLKEMGSVGEKVMAKYLNFPESGVRKDICEILGEIGTKDALKYLQATATRDPDAGVRMEAAKAIQAINKR